ncbi:MAG TPA: acetamidase/formamidase family protein [Acidimicrobiales bacterium]|nr:acetamidase/formamidase family protein [Acidimicrobiales bacterium]
MRDDDPGCPLVTAAAGTVSWGWLPNAASHPVLAVAPGDVVCVDTISHEGILDDQGRDPVRFFGDLGIPRHAVLADAVELAASDVVHDERAGPHVVIGPIAVRGATVGDILEVETLRLRRRTDYGIISNRHGRGALPDEYPARPASGEPPPPVCVLATVEGSRGVLRWGRGRQARFPLNPFLGIMGVAPATEEPVHSVPPGPHGGNLDVNLVGEGSRLYLPVLVPDAMFYVSDPHFAQGDGEVALTAFEAPLRAWMRLSVHRNRAARHLAAVLRQPFAETAESWIVVGLDVDLDEAMRAATRQAIAFLVEHVGMPPPLALAYLSAAADFEVSQVVDRVKGVHCVIRKHDFGAPAWLGNDWLKQ